MGKEWYWGGKSSKRGGQNVDRDAISSSSSSSSSSSAGCMCAVFQLFDFHQFQFTSLNHPHHETASSFKPTTSRNTTSTTLYQLPQEADNIPKGVEAPRNSLKSEEGSTSLSSIIEKEDEESLNLNIPMGIQIKTSTGSGSRSAGKSGLSPSDFSSDTSSNSPGTKTPSLVARLMGLDLLPESSSPTIHATQKQLYLSRSHTQPLRSRQPRLRNKARHLLDGDSSAGTRSLPETPRVSSARRSDVDHHHRLSLQINKENIVDHDLNLDFSKLSALRRKQLRVEEHTCESSSRSPGHYAREIVKQVKESVSRKVGLDVTNTILITRNRSDNHHHELVNQLKSKRSSVSNPSLSKLEEQASRSGKQNSSSSSSMSTTTSSSSTCSPRLMTRFTDSKTSTNPTTTPLSTSPKDHQTSQLSTVKVNGAKSNSKGTHYQTLQEQQQQQQKMVIKSRINNINDHIVKGGNYGREIGGATFGRRLQKMQEETFVRPSTAASCRTNIPDKKKCKKTPLSNNLINLNVVVPTLPPLKKSSNSPPSTCNKHVFSSPIQPTAAEVPDDAQESKRSSQLSSSQSQKYYSQGPQPSSHVLHTRDIIINDVVHVPNGVATSATATSTATTARGGGSKSELQILRHYISRILARTGIANASHVSFTNWFSPSHPLDPSIFHRLEISMYVNNNNNVDLSNVGQFCLRCNRRLLFDVVDEILADILRRYINLRPWINNYSTNNAKYYINIGSELIDTLCSRIQRFPCRDCQVLEDIDALIDKDMPDRFMKIQKEMAFEEEGEGLVTEIERDIVDTLVHETALILVGTW